VEDSIGERITLYVTLRMSMLILLKWFRIGFGDGSNLEILHLVKRNDYRFWSRHIY
jgi:hypothetical protein